MSYRKLGRDNKHRRSMLANLTIDVIKNEKIETTETRAKEVKRCLDKVITYGKDGSLVFDYYIIWLISKNNETEVNEEGKPKEINKEEIAKKVFDDLAVRYKDRNGGYSRILKLDERKGDGALVVILELVK